MKLESFRLSEELSNKLDKFANKIEVNHSEAIRLSIEDSINRYTWPGEEIEGYKILNPEADKTSKILAVMIAIKNRKLTESVRKYLNEINEIEDEKKQKERIKELANKFVG
jgi:predicted DNA-binding protein